VEKDEVQKDFYLYSRPREKGRPIWYVKFRDPITRAILPGRSSGLTNETRAEDWARKEYAKRARTPRGSELVVTYLAGFWRLDGDYATLSAKEGRALSSAYLAGSARYIELYFKTSKAFAGLMIRDVQPRHFKAWKLEMASKGARTVNRAMQAATVPIRAWFRERNLADPIPRIPKLKESTPSGEILLTYTEGLKLLQVEPVAGGGKHPYERPAGPGHPAADSTLAPIDPRGKAAVLVGAFCGLRLGEVRGARWEHLYRTPGGILMLRVCLNIPTGSSEAKGPKWGSDRDVPVPAEVETALEVVASRSPFKRLGYILANWGLGPETPMSEKAISNQLRNILVAAGIAHPVTFHDLRHFYGSYCRKRGLPLGDVAALMGHRNLKMTGDVYTNRLYDDEETAKILAGKEAPTS
jgi:integrase